MVVKPSPMPRSLLPAPLAVLPWADAQIGRVLAAVRTVTHRYVEWRRFGTREVVARELYSCAGDELFEPANLAGDPAQQDRIVELAALLPGGPR